MNEKHTGIGRSSFDAVDTKRLFALLPLREGSFFLDLGCGRGDYSLAAAGRVGQSGRVYAVDKWEEGILTLKERIADKAIKNMTALQSDMAERLPLDDRSIDVCLMAGVFHHLLQEGSHGRVLDELGRILKAEGSLALIEFKKEAGPPGPPITMRIAPEELCALLSPHGFGETRTLEIGTHHYLSLFELR